MLVVDLAEGALGHDRLLLSANTHMRILIIWDSYIDERVRDLRLLQLIDGQGIVAVLARL